MANLKALRIYVLREERKMPNIVSMVLVKKESRLGVDLYQTA